MPSKPIGWDVRPDGSLRPLRAARGSVARVGQAKEQRGPKKRNPILDPIFEAEKNLPELIRKLADLFLEVGLTPIEIIDRLTKRFGIAAVALVAGGLYVATRRRDKE